MIFIDSDKDTLNICPDSTELQYACIADTREKSATALLVSVQKYIPFQVLMSSMILCFFK
jgi:hypothetical protein